MPKVQVNSCNLAVCGLNRRLVCDSSTLIAIEEWQIYVESEGSVVKRLSNRSKVSRCIESLLGKAAVRALITPKYAGVRFGCCLI